MNARCRSILLVGLCTLWGSAALAGVEERCDQMGRSSLKEIYNWDPKFVEALETGTWQDVFNRLWQPSPLYRSIDPWILLSHPRREPKRAAFEWTLWQITYHNGADLGEGMELPSDRPRRAWVRKFLEEFQRKDVQYSDWHRLRVNTRFEEVRKTRTFGEIAQLEASAREAFWAYGKLSGARALDDLLERALPRFWSNLCFSMPDVSRTLLLQEKYAKPLARTALRILDRVEDAERGMSVESNLFKDLSEEFNLAGLGEEEVWNVLAFYGTRGSSIDGFVSLGTEESLPMWNSLMLIFTGTSYLDSFRSADGRNYSYPDFVRTQCNYGGPYHFWLSAYLTHWLKQKGYSSATSLLATYIAGMGYEFRSGTFGRNPELPYFEPADSLYNSSLRRNLVFDLAGTVSALRLSGDSSSTAIIDIDKGLDTLEKSSKAPFRLPKEQIFEAIKNPLHRYCWWRRITRPDRLVSQWAWQKAGIAVATMAIPTQELACSPYYAVKESPKLDLKPLVHATSTNLQPWVNEP